MYKYYILLRSYPSTTLGTNGWLGLPITSLLCPRWLMAKFGTKRKNLNQFIKKLVWFCIATQITNHRVILASKTVYTPRASIENSALAFSLTNYEKYDNYFTNSNHKHSKTYLRATPFFQKSTHEKNISPFFLPGNKTAITIAEDGSGDINSLWLSVTAPKHELYSSTLTFYPERSIVGGLFEYNQDLSCIFTGLWFDIKIAIAHAEHDLNAQENITGSKGEVAGSYSALEFLESTALKYGKISSKKQSRNGIDGLFIQLGGNLIESNRSHIDIYGSVAAPVDNSIEACYLFAPLVGRGKHTGLGAGINAGKSYGSHNNHAFNLSTDLFYEYLLEANELRSFDLKNNGDWSRYLKLVTADHAEIGFPAIHIFTQPLSVTPGSRVNWWTAAHYAHTSWHAEIGYNLWWKQAEKVDVSSSITIPYFAAIQDLGAFLTGKEFLSASTATISQGIQAITSDAELITLSDDDFDLCSATQESATSNTIYATIGYELPCIRNCPVLCGLAGSYEFFNTDTILNNYTLWAHLILSF